jgi:hypothetical protein
MQRLKLFGLLAIFVFFNIHCSSNRPNNSEVKMDNSSEVKTNRPQYEITVFQAGKELGKIKLETFPDEAPKHSANFDSLVSAGFYDGTAFHRVIEGFMIQGGDPNSKNFPNDKSK